MNILDRAIKEKLDGDKSRLAELFQDEAFYNELVSAGSDNDWLHYTPKKFDGLYLVKSEQGFSCYGQERGEKYHVKTFNNLTEASTYFYIMAGYLEK